MAEDKDTFVMLAIRHGEVCGMCVISNDKVLSDSVTEWALDPTVSELIRVPLEVARGSFLAPVKRVRDALASLPAQAQP